MSLSKNITAYEHRHMTSPSFAFVFENDKGNTTYYNWESPACYGVLKGGYKLANSTQLKQIVAGVRTKPNVSPSMMENYWSYLTSPTGPYYKLLENGFQFHKESLSKKNGNYIEVNINKDTNLQFIISFLMNMRLGRDNPSQVRMFNALLEQGFKEHEALYTSIYFNMTERGHIISGQYSDSKGWFAYADNDLELIKKGKPKLESQYSIDKGYRYISRIWLKNPEDYINKMAREQNCTIYSSFKPEKRYRGEFGEYYKKQQEKIGLSYNISLNELVEKKNEYISK